MAAWLRFSFFNFGFQGLVAFVLIGILLLQVGKRILQCPQFDIREFEVQLSILHAAREM